MINGAMATARDFDDTLDDGMLHTQPSVLPAVLAVAEVEGGHTGRDLITAVAVGAELLCRMGHAGGGGRSFCRRVPAPAWLPRPQPHALLNCRSRGCWIPAASPTANVRPTCKPLIEGATIKRFHAGFAARNGVISATLARHGLTGAHNWLEGRLGYYNLYEGGDYEPANLTTELGVRFELLGLAIKPWPSARDTHGAVEAALTLAGEHDIHVDEIASVEAFLVPNAFSLSGKPWAQANGHPVVEAIASAAYCVAVCLLRRELLLEDFTEERSPTPRWMRWLGGYKSVRSPASTIRCRSPPKAFGSG